CEPGWNQENHQGQHNNSAQAHSALLLEGGSTVVGGIISSVTQACGNPSFKINLAPMFSPFNRRSFLKEACLASAVFSVGRSTLGAIADSPIKATRLTENLTLLTGGGGNIVVLDTPDGLLLVNGGLPERTTDFMRFMDDHFKTKR